MCGCGRWGRWTLVMWAAGSEVGRGGSLPSSRLQPAPAQRAPSGVNERQLVLWARLQPLATGLRLDGFLALSQPLCSLSGSPVAVFGHPVAFIR